jgi:hypothetical protein
MRPRVLLPVCAAAAAFAGPPVAQASTSVMGIVLSVDTATHTMTTAICGIAGVYTLPWQDPVIAPYVGRVYNAQVEAGPPVYVSSSTLMPEGYPCDVVLGGVPGQTPAPGSPDDLTGEDLGAALPASAFTRVLTVKIDVDGYEGGRISATIASVQGLSKTLQHDFNELVDDRDAIVLVSSDVKVRDQRGRRVSRARLDDADTASVKGKLLRPGQWREDDDGNPVPTVRAKQVTITG